MNTFREAMTEAKDHLALGLDVDNWQQAKQLIEATSDHVGIYKVNSLAQEKGWEHAIETIASLGSLTIADTKFSDTPDTVRQSVRDITKIGASLITVQSTGDTNMLTAAIAGREEGREQIKNPFYRSKNHVLGGIIVSTVLTSTSEEQCLRDSGMTVKERVLYLTETAAEAGADGVSCSIEEVKAIRAIKDFDDLLVVVASITPSWTHKPVEQKRTGTPTQAIEYGADLLFLGRKIRDPEQGMAITTAAKRVNEEVAQALYPHSNQSSQTS